MLLLKIIIFTVTAVPRLTSARPVDGESSTTSTETAAETTTVITGVPEDSVAPTTTIASVPEDLVVSTTTTAGAPKDLVASTTTIADVPENRTTSTTTTVRPAADTPSSEVSRPTSDGVPAPPLITTTGGVETTTAGVETTTAGAKTTIAGTETTTAGAAMASNSPDSAAAAGLPVTTTAGAGTPSVMPSTSEDATSSSPTGPTMTFVVAPTRRTTTTVVAPLVLPVTSANLIKVVNTVTPRAPDPPTTTRRPTAPVTSSAPEIVQCYEILPFIYCCNTPHATYVVNLMM